MITATCNSATIAVLCCLQRKNRLLMPLKSVTFPHPKVSMASADTKRGRVSRSLPVSVQHSPAPNPTTPFCRILASPCLPGGASPVLNPPQALSISAPHSSQSVLCVQRSSARQPPEQWNTTNRCIGGAHVSRPAADGMTSQGVTSSSGDTARSGAMDNGREGRNEYKSGSIGHDLCPRLKDEH